MIKCASLRQYHAVSLNWVLAALIGWVSIDNALLFAFLGKNYWAACAASLAATVAITYLVARMPSNVLRAEISIKTLLFCVFAALFLLILGGEGRFLYANPDWQIRDTLLRDMGNNSWPFFYNINGNTEILRAPIGMYLKPAIIGGSSQVKRDLAILFCNTLILGGLFAAGSVLFQNTKMRIIAFLVFVFFSGLDVIGFGILHHMGSLLAFDHLEPWLPSSQYSSHITQLFWVPQHAFAGWFCALLFLLWERRYIRFSLFFAAIPLLAIWSPLAIMGAVPFAIYVGIVILWRRDILSSDIMICLLSLALSISALLYLRSGFSDVKSTIETLPILNFMLLLLVEIIPFAIFLVVKPSEYGFGITIAAANITIICLLIMPHYRIGVSNDFQMRASIMPLAILGITMAGVITDVGSRSSRLILSILLLIGSVTGLMEIKRSFMYRPSPPSQCSMIQAWYQQTGLIADTSTYFAPRTSLPPILQPSFIKPAYASGAKQCWSREWAS